jgi:hypothetical protein
LPSNNEAASSGMKVRIKKGKRSTRFFTSDMTAEQSSASLLFYLPDSEFKPYPEKLKKNKLSKKF